MISPENNDGHDGDDDDDDDDDDSDDDGEASASGSSSTYLFGVHRSELLCRGLKDEVL